MTFVSEKCESRFYSYTEYLQKQFPFPVQKISLNVGNTCPNRDGSEGFGGCTYCNIDSFNPAYCNSDTDLTDQLEKGIQFFSHKKKSPRFLAYFQAYSNTYSDSQLLISLFEKVRQHPKMEGIIIGTRPDCISEDMIVYLSEMSKNYFVSVEIGIESTLNRTLELVNRCHTYEDTLDAFQRLKGKGIKLGGHLILGLPGESDAEIISHAKKVSSLPLDTIKLHHLQIIRHTIMAHQYKTLPNLFRFRNFEAYTDLVCEFLRNLRQDIAIERFMSQSPANLLLAPDWGGIKNYHAKGILEIKLQENNWRQGDLLKT